MDKYYQGETYPQKVHVTDKDGTDIDPDTITITIEDVIGVKKVTGDAMINDTTGYYHYYYLIPSDADLGEWTAEVTATKTEVAIERDIFLVLEAL